MLATFLSFGTLSFSFLTFVRVTMTALITFFTFFMTVTFFYHDHKIFHRDVHILRDPRFFSLYAQEVTPIKKAESPRNNIKFFICLKIFGKYNSILEYRDSFNLVLTQSYFRIARNSLASLYFLFQSYSNFGRERNKYVDSRSKFDKTSFIFSLNLLVYFSKKSNSSSNGSCNLSEQNRSSLGVFNNYCCSFVFSRGILDAMLPNSFPDGT